MGGRDRDALNVGQRAQPVVDRAGADARPVELLGLHRRGERVRVGHPDDVLVEQRPPEVEVWVGLHLEVLRVDVLDRLEGPLPIGLVA